MEPDHTVDDWLRRLPQPQKAPPDPAKLAALRARRLDEAAAAEVEAALADSPLGRGFYALLKADVDERQLRLAVEAALRPPQARAGQRRWTWAGVGGLLALAVVGLLAWWGPPPPPLPGFEVAIWIDDKPAVAAPGEALSLSGNDVLRVQLTPREPLRHAPSVRIFASLQGAPLDPVDVPIRRQPDGSFTATAVGQAWVGRARGRFDLLFGLSPAGRPLVLPTRVDAREARKGNPVAAWLTVPVDYRRTPRP
ncbi:MAG: hypothetical protein H6706_24930 [Myxococcales bacterium]|nr:hypothetical protein [Myxococcales bacterium]